jgi:hypothetical protein
MTQTPVLHFVVGDIHGCYREFLELEDDIAAYCEALQSKPFLISVGDLIDRGPHSKEVVQYFAKKVKAGEAAAVAGNHEAVLFDLLVEFAPHVLNRAGIPVEKHLPPFAQGLKAIRKFGTPADDPEAKNIDYKVFSERLLISWLRQGGMETLNSFGCDQVDPKTWDLDPAAVRFMHGLPMLWENGRIIVTHALASFKDMTFARECIAGDLDYPRDCEEYYTRLDGVLWSRKQPEIRVDPLRLHISGHTPSNEPMYNKALASLIVDTGCCFGNMLTAWCVEKEEFLQVRAR